MDNARHGAVATPVALVAPEPPPDATAARVDRILEVVPRVVHRIKRKMREGATPGLTVPQFRALRWIRKDPGVGVSGLAEHLGMSVTATSALVERLVRAGELERLGDEDERRRVRLFVSAQGEERVARAEGATRAWLAAEIEGLDAAALDRLDAALEVLARLGAGSGR